MVFRASLIFFSVCVHCWQTNKTIIMKWNYLNFWMFIVEYLTLLFYLSAHVLHYNNFSSFMSACFLLHTEHSFQVVIFRRKAILQIRNEIKKQSERASERARERERMKTHKSKNHYRHCFYANGFFPFIWIRHLCIKFKSHG